MANTSRISGFKPAKSLVGGDWTSLVRQYNADAAKANGIFIGDPVTLDTDGNVIRSATNDTILGVVIAVGEDVSNFGPAGYFNANDLGKRYLASAEAGVVGVVPAEMSLFEVYDDGTDLDLAQGDTADIAPAAGSTTTGNSGYSITTATNNDVKVVEQVTAPDNDPSLADARYLVKFTKTEHALN